MEKQRSWTMMVVMIMIVIIIECYKDLFGVFGSMLVGALLSFISYQAWKKDLATREKN